MNFDEAQNNYVGTITWGQLFTMKPMNKFAFNQLFHFWVAL
jgi:hypothetical protein